MVEFEDVEEKYKSLMAARESVKCSLKNILNEIIRELEANSSSKFKGKLKLEESVDYPGEGTQYHIVDSRNVLKIFELYGDKVAGVFINIPLSSSDIRYLNISFKDDAIGEVLKRYIGEFAQERGVKKVRVGRLN